MKNFVWCLLAAVTLLPISLQASPYHITTVKWIVDNRNKITYDDHYVTMVGHVTRRMGDEEYWFTDGTGSIRLDSENFDLPIGKGIVVGGRIDEAYLGFGHIEVDVRAWHYPVHKPATAVAATKPAPAKAASEAPAPAPSALAPAATLSPTPVSTEAPAPRVVPPPPAPTTTTPVSGPVSDATPAAAASTTTPEPSAPSTNIAVPTLNPPPETGK